MKRTKVLIFPCGSEGALEIYDALKYNIHFELYGISGKKNYTDFLYPKGMFFYTDERFYINHPDFEKAFADFISIHDIEYIIPTFDDVALKLAELQPKLSATVVVSPYETTLVASDKRLMYKAIVGEKYAPTVYESIDDVHNYPVFVKPAVGCASQGAHIINDRVQLVNDVSDRNDIVICENLPGEEITVDCFTNRHGELLYVGPRERERIWHGITFRGKTVSLTDEIQHIAESLNRKLTFRGAWFFQAKRDCNGILKLLEFSVRQSTNSSLNTRLGFNSSALSLFDAMNIDVSVIRNDFTIQQERRISASYKTNIDFETLYIDFDDTITTHEMVNTVMLRLVYQCINKGKRVVLLSRHNTGDLYEEMKHYRILPEMFDEVIWIRDDTPKSAYITDEKAVFVDNAFRERLDVSLNRGIPVFDVEAADCLIDESCY